jgi:hypothetical protein
VRVWKTHFKSREMRNTAELKRMRLACLLLLVQAAPAFHILQHSAHFSKFNKKWNDVSRKDRFLSDSGPHNSGWEPAVKQYLNTKGKKSEVVPSGLSENARQEAELFFASIGLKFPVSASPAGAFRTRAKLSVQSLTRWGGVRIGLYRKGTHDVEDLSGIADHHPSINAAIDLVKKACVSVGVSGYQAKTNAYPSSGLLRYMQLTVERSTGKVQLVLVWNEADAKSSGELLPRFVRELLKSSTLWQGIFVNFNDKETNTIFNFDHNAWKRYYGPPATREVVGNATVFFPPEAFRQVTILPCNHPDYVSYHVYLIFDAFIGQFRWL